MPLESRQGGAGPADAGMLWVDGFAATVPTGAHYARTSPYVLRAEDDGWAVYRDGERLASAEPSRRPRYYDDTQEDALLLTLDWSEDGNDSGEGTGSRRL